MLNSKFEIGLLEIIMVNIRIMKTEEGIVIEGLAVIQSTADLLSPVFLLFRGALRLATDHRIARAATI
jgi:hypothetical protein